MELDWFQKLVMESAATADEAVRRIPTHCLCPGCAQPPIRSHSQQAKGALSVIARDGKVVAPTRSFFQIFRQGLDRGKLEGRFSFQTVNKASTFMGFCAKHDTELFLGIERRPLTVGNENQILSFHRRAVAFELRNKFDMIAFLNENFRQLIACGVVPADLVKEFRVHRLLLRGDFDFIWAPLWSDRPSQNISHEWRTIPRKIGVSMTSVISAISEKHLFTYSNRHIDLDKNVIDRPRPSFTLTIVPQETETHVVMAWNRCVEPFIGPFRERMISKDDKVFAGFLNQCVFCLSEDFCLSPDLWDSLSAETKAELEKDLSTEDYRMPVIVPDIIKV